MSSLVAAPEFLASAATDLSNIGSTLDRSQRGGGDHDDVVLAAAEDEVSAAIAAVFSGHGQGFQALSAQAAAFHDQFVQALSAGAGSYVRAEAANVAAFTANPAQTIGQDLTQRDQCAQPGADGPPADRQRRQRGPGDRGRTAAPGGWLLGNGGAGGSGARA